MCYCYQKSCCFVVGFCCKTVDFLSSCCGCGAGVNKMWWLDSLDMKQLLKYRPSFTSLLLLVFQNNLCVVVVGFWHYCCGWLLCGWWVDASRSHDSGVAAFVNAATARGGDRGSDSSSETTQKPFSQLDERIRDQLDFFQLQPDRLLRRVWILSGMRWFPDVPVGFIREKSVSRQWPLSEWERFSRNESPHKKRTLKWEQGEVKRYVKM